jgi:hypothetical protein
VATGRSSAHHWEYDPGYRLARIPTRSAASTSWQAVMPEPHEATTSVPARTPDACRRSAISAGDRVERLHLAPVAGGGPHVQQHRVGVGRGDGRPVSVDDGEGAGRHGDRAGSDRIGRAGLRRPGRVGGSVVGVTVRPGRIAAVQHPHRGQAGPPQQPPRPGRGQPGAAVVDDDLVPVVQPGRAQGRLQVGRIGQRVPAAAARCGGKVPVQVQEPGAGKVAGQVTGRIAALGQRPADVQQDRRRPAGESLRQLIDGDQRGQRGVGHRRLL